MAKKSVIKIPGKAGLTEVSGTVVWASVGNRKHKFFIVDQGPASRPILSDWASGYIVARLPEKGVFHCATIKQRVESAIADLINRTIRDVEKKNRSLMSQEAYDRALKQIYMILDDVTVINGKPTQYHKAQLAANTDKAIDTIKKLHEAKPAIVASPKKERAKN